MDAFCAVKLNGGVTLALGTPVTCDAACAPQRPRTEFYLALILRCFTQNQYRYNALIYDNILCQGQGHLAGGAFKRIDEYVAARDAQHG